MSEESQNSVETLERELFLGALEKQTPAERAAYLDVACAGEIAMRQRIDELLREHDKVGAFLEEPAVSTPRPDSTAEGGRGPAGTIFLNLVSEKPGDRIGRYKLLQQIGEGGCGVVYMAEQEEPVRRRVALKVIKLGMDTKSVIARFEAERQALAMMDHPNIAKVFDAGATETGRPYFVMELVRGVKITEYCDEHHLPPDQRLGLFVEVCQAIQHAHQKGIIHRDVKPSNILVTLHDGVPVPKVIDFGIAKATEQRLTSKTLFTEFTAFIGTPAYMSPEQAEMSGLDIDTRSDIYSLGVVLYELLTGKTPFDPEALLQAGLDECRRTIREKEPMRPSTRVATMLAAERTTTAHQRHTEAPKLVHLLQGDLDWIAMKCLEKDRTRRYETATGLAQDVQRYLNDEPVLARPPSNIYRLQKLLHRHRGAVAAAAGIAATLLIGVAISTWQAVRATRAEHKETQLRLQAEKEKERAEVEKRASRLNEYVADITLAAQKMSVDGNYGKAMQLLNKHLPKPGEPDLRGFEWRYLRQLSQGDASAALPLQDGPVQSVACSPDGRWVAVGLRDKSSIWTSGTKSLVTNLPEGALSLAFLPDSKTLLTATPAGVRVWRTEDWSEQRSLAKSASPIVLSKDGSLVATETERQFGGHGRSSVRVWNTSTWTEQKVLPNASAPMAFAPDGKFLLAQSGPGMTLWPLTENGAELVLQNSTNLFFRPGPWFGSGQVVAFSPDGRSIVAPRNSLSDRGVFVLSIWDAHSGEEIALMPKDPQHVEHTGIISSLAFSPDGNTLATASWDHSIHLWDFAKRQPKLTLHGHLNEIWSMAFSGDGQIIVSGSKDGAVKFWPTEPSPSDDLLPLTGSWELLGFSSDSSRLAVYTRPGTVAFFDLFSGQIERRFTLENQRDRFGPRPPPGPFSSGIALSADLSMLAHALPDGTVRLWNTATGETNELKVADGRVETIALSPDGQVLVTGGHSTTLQWWDLAAGTKGELPASTFKAWFSPDGRALATHHRDEGIELWDMKAHALRAKIKFESSIVSIAFSPDSGFLAATTGPDDPDNAVHLWNANTGQLLGVFTGHKQAVWSVAFSSDGATLATASDDSTLRLWNVATQQELLSVRRLGGGLRGLRFSPDGQLLAGASGQFSQNGGIHLLRAPRLARTSVLSLSPK